MKKIHELADEGIKFYYVTLVDNGKGRISDGETDNDAEDRIYEYNIKAYPTVLIDGGNYAYLGGKEKNVYKAAILSSLEREVPDIEIFVSAESKTRCGRRGKSGARVRNDVGVAAGAQCNDRSLRR